MLLLHEHNPAQIFMLMLCCCYVIVWPCCWLCLFEVVCVMMNIVDYKCQCCCCWNLGFSRNHVLWGLSIVVAHAAWSISIPCCCFETYHVQNFFLMILLVWLLVNIAWWWRFMALIIGWLLCSCAVDLNDEWWWILLLFWNPLLFPEIQLMYVVCCLLYKHHECVLPCGFHVFVWFRHDDETEGWNTAAVLNPMNSAQKTLMNCIWYVVVRLLYGLYLNAVLLC